VYFNAGDLNLGRDMHCVPFIGRTNRTACYVTNYGPAPFDNKAGARNPLWPNETLALSDAVAAARLQAGGGAPFATVAMEWTPFSTTQPNISVPESSIGDTITTVRPGDIVKLRASGSIWNGFLFGARTGPEGTNQNFADPGYPIPGQCSFALIARVGGPWFCVATPAGVEFVYTHLGAAAPLELRINDNTPGNGNGAFDVIVTVERANNVTFYVYVGETRVPTAALDAEGDKPVPQMCMACHGGDNSTAATLIQGASFLPFDLGSFHYSADAGFTRPDQEEAFRKLNAIVRSTNPNPRNPHDPIRQWIDGMYTNTVNTPNTRSRDDFVPQGWNSQRGPYLNFVAPYCRSCHVSVKNELLDFTRHIDFKFQALTRTDVCRDRKMPHAQVPFEKFWATPLVALVLDDPNVLQPPGPGEKLCRDES
jgi:hypothetical protein